MFAPMMFPTENLTLTPQHPRESGEEFGQGGPDGDETDPDGKLADVKPPGDGDGTLDDHVGAGDHPDEPPRRIDVMRPCPTRT